MKRIGLIGSLLLVSCYATQAQGERSVKDPNEIGACVNITSKLSVINTGPIVNGAVTVWTLDEVLLVAKVTEQRANGRTTRARTGWAIVDPAGNQIPFSEATRERPRANKRYFQRLIYTRGTNPEGCFVVEQKEV